MAKRTAWLVVLEHPGDDRLLIEFALAEAGIMDVEYTDDPGIVMDGIESPHIAGAIGPLWYLEVLQQAKAAYANVSAIGIIDCGSDAGWAIAALRCGHSAIYFSGPKNLTKKLQSMARQLDGEIITDALDLFDLMDEKDPRLACLEWLKSAPKPDEK